MTKNISSPSSASSNDENYFSATEYVSPEKDGDRGSNSKDENNIEENRDETKVNDVHFPLKASVTTLNDASHRAMEFVNRYASVEPPRDDDNDNGDGDGDGDDPMQSGAKSSNPWNNMEAVAEGLEKARQNLEEAWRDTKVVHDKELQRCSETEDEYVSDDDDDDENTDAKHGFAAIDFDLAVDLDMETSIDAAAVNDDDDKESDAWNKEEKESDDNDDDAQFRTLYVDMMTETFGDDLEEVHQQNDEKTSDVNVFVDVEVLVECLQSGIRFLEPHETKDSKSFFESLRYNGTGDDGTRKHNDDDDDEKTDGLTVHQIRQRRLGYILPKEDEE